MRIPLDRNLVVLAALAGAAAPVARGQEPGSDTLSRATICERATTVLKRGARGEAYSGALSDLPACSLGPCAVRLAALEALVGYCEPGLG